jgi:rare lipoprotein A
MVAGSSASERSNIPDAVPRVEPLSKWGNPESYKVKGKRYFTKKTSSGHVERGLASWYGKQFHGRRTSSGERYNMYEMTAAHKTLPLPSYVRVTNMENGRTAVVKVNDRGPFHGGRVIDLSYSAAKKLGVVQKGTAMVEVAAIDPLAPDAEPGPFLAAAKGKPKKLTHSERPVPTRSEPEPVSAPVLAAASSAGTGSSEIRERGVDPAIAAREVEPVAEPASKASEERPDEVPSPVAVADASKPNLYLQVGAFGDPGNAERLRRRLVANLPDMVSVQRTSTGEPALYKVRVGPLGSEGEAKAISARLVRLGVEEPRRIWN